MTKKPNIILITIDALRADHLGFMGYEKNISLNIDKLAQESTIFTRAFANGPTTPCSFPSILTSTYPLDYQGPKTIDKPRVLLSEALKEQGYITAAFHSNPWLSDFFGYNRGWDFFEDINYSTNISSENFLKKLFKELTLSTFPQLLFWTMYLKYRIKKDPRNKFKIKASFINQIVRDFIYSVKTEKSPFFIWIHYMDIHSPYLAQDSYYSENKPCSYSELIGDYVSSMWSTYAHKKALKKFIKNNFKKYIKKTLSFYDQAIECVDRGVGELLDFLKKEEVYHNSIICLTADHGDEFLEHGGIGHNTAKLYNELLHVPFLIKLPESQNQTVKKKVSLIDLASTICDLVGIKPPSSFKGKNLFERKEDLIFHQVSSLLRKTKDWKGAIKKLSQYKVACQSNTWKYILDQGTGVEELYNLSKDSKEQNNLSQFEPEVLSQMRKKVQEFKKENPPLSSLDYE